MSAEKKSVAGGDYRIPEKSGWAGAWKVFAGIGVVGLGLAAAGWAMDAKRFAFSYLFAFFLILTICFGSMFFVLIERLTGASWSITTRRVAEFFIAPAWVFAILFVPVFLCRDTLYPWLHHGEQTSAIEGTAHAQPNEPATPPGAPTPRPQMGHPVPQHPGMGLGMPRGAQAREPGMSPEEKAEEETLAKKHAWLNLSAWSIRAVIYFLAWAWLGATFFGISTSQDKTKDPKLTVRAQKLAPVATILFALTLTGAAFDWLMSMLPTWYSTIYGVTIFAGSVVCMYATMIIVTLALNNAGLLKNAVNVEHYHDMGKLLFGFLVFWAYTSFAQFMLIWYAAIPEETDFYHHRWDVGPWATVSLAIVVLHFVVPFFLLLSRNVKRRTWALQIGAGWLLFMHLVEMYWFVLPYFNGGDVTPSWVDAACLLGVAGVYLAVVFQRMTQYPLIPVGDPRLSRALAFENA